MLIVSLMTLAFGAWSVRTVREWIHDQPIEQFCGDFLRAPKAGWFKLKECTLDVNAMVLESSNGEFEPLDNRRKGISSKLYDGTPQWVAALIPITTPMDRGARRAAMRSESEDLLKWLNAHELADDARREKMWADPAVLLRMTRPSVLEGESVKPEGDLIPRAFGPAASVNMHFFTIGKAPERTHVAVTLGIGFVLWVALVLIISRFAKAPRLDHELTPEQVTAKNIVGGTKVELGALEELRREERERTRTNKRSG